MYVHVCVHVCMCACVFAVQCDSGVGVLVLGGSSFPAGWAGPQGVRWPKVVPGAGLAGRDLGCVCACVLCMHTHLEGRGQERVLLNSFPYPSRQGVSLKLELTALARPDDQ